MGNELCIGQQVRATRDIWEDADDYSPGGFLARRGDILFVRKIGGECHFFPFYVSHEGRNDASFGVKADEIRSAMPAS